MHFFASALSKLSLLSGFCSHSLIPQKIRHLPTAPLLYRAQFCQMERNFTQFRSLSSNPTIMSAFLLSPLQISPKSVLQQSRQGQTCRRRQYPSAIAKRMVHAYSSEPLHPVLEILKHRLETSSKPGRRRDNHKVALCIEGGGMRGSVSAGMVAAIKYCGLEDTFDAVYGSSAGSIVGAYFVSRQLPMYGAQIYYDVICSTPENGQRFIDLWALRHHPYFRPGWKKKQFYGEGTRPVLLLDRLIDNVMRTQHPLDWNAFSRTHAHQPLKPVASSLTLMKARTLDGFTTKDELLECLRASARVPGIAGNPVEIDGHFYADGLLFEPIPYRSALRDGCTDVLVLRSRPEGSSGKSTKPGIFEKHIATPYFDLFPSFAPRAKASDYLQEGLHLDVYHEDLQRLQKEQMEPNGSGTAIFSITPHADSPKVGKLESRARVIYEGVKSGFAAAYDTLSPFADVNLDDVAIVSVRTAKGEEQQQRATQGRRVSKWVYSDEEIEGVERRHREARQAVVQMRKRRRMELSAESQEKVRQENLKRALKRRRAERARQKRREMEEKFVRTIEEQYFPE